MGITSRFLALLVILFNSEAALAERTCTQKSEKLTTEELRELFVGSTIRGQFIGGIWEATFDASGNIKYTDVSDGGKRYRGNFSIADDKYCVNYPGYGSSCQVVYKCASGEGLYHVESTSGYNTRLITDVSSSDSPSKSRSDKAGYTKTTVAGYNFSIKVENKKYCHCGLMRVCNSDLSILILRNSGDAEKVFEDRYKSERAAKELVTHYDQKCRDYLNKNNYVAMGHKFFANFHWDSGEEISNASLVDMYNKVEFHYEDLLWNRKAAAETKKLEFERAEAERQSRLQRRQKQRDTYLNFMIEFDVKQLTTADAVASNPFVFDSMVFGIALNFKEMLSRESALFSSGSRQFVIEDLSDVKSLELEQNYLFAVTFEDLREFVLSSGASRLVVLREIGRRTCVSENCEEFFAGKAFAEQDEG